MTKRTLVIGVGNPDRGDDGAGRLVARLLRDELDLVSGVEIREHNGEVSTLLDWLIEGDAVYIIDAASSGSAPGTIHRFDANEGPIPQSLAALSTHGFGPAEAVELARAMGRLPAISIVYAIEGESFETGHPVSRPVEDSARSLADSLARELAVGLNNRD